MNNNITSVIKISALALVLSFGLSYALAWTAPTATPPGNNVDAPINVGSTAQTKLGDLTLGRLFTTASSSIGTTAQTQTLTVAGTIGATGDVCTAVGGGKCLGTMSAGGAIDPAPVGSIVSYAGTTAPSGYLFCNGASLLRTAYPALFAAIGTTYGAVDATHFNLPDLRGEFIRGFDNGRGIDAGRVFGSWQADEFKSHVHNMGRVAGGYSGLQFTWGGGGMSDIAPNTTAAGGVETRPRNIALNYIIKAEQASVVATSTLNVVSTLTAGAGITLDKVSPATGDVTVTAAALGVGQTWQNVTSGRSLGTTYTNTTNKTIFVSVNTGCVGGGVTDFTVSGVLAGRGYCSSYANASIFIPVPSGATYLVQGTAGVVLQQWSELR